MSSPSGDAGSFAAVGDGSEEQQAAAKRKRNLPGTPDPQAEVVALSPKTLMATNRFLCEVCGKGFQRDQNLQLHRRGHNLPWKLKQRDGQEIKKRVYVCPEASCVHHHPSRALGDLTGIKKHFSRKHGEKKWKCEKCSKRYAVHSDWKAHQKVCGTREYRCDCGTLFSRKDSFTTHRAFCEALVQENVRLSANRQVEQPSCLDGNALTSPVGSSAIEAPSTPLSQQTTSEHPDGEVSEPLVRDIWEPNTALNEDRVSPLTSKRVHAGLAVMSHKLSAGPGLSLCLGTGLGPGPPCASTERIGSVSQTEAKSASKQMNNLVGVGSQRDDSTWPLPLASAGIFTSMLTAAGREPELQGYASGKYAGNGMAGLSMGSNSLIGSSMASQFANSAFLERGFIPSKHHRQHTGSSQLPATTLLQKAAMMGSTKSNSFLYRNLGLGADSGSLSPGDSQQHDSWAGVTSSLSSSRHSSLSVKPAAEGSCLEVGPIYGAIGAGGSYSTSYGGQDSRHEFRDSLCSQAMRRENVYHAASSSLSTPGGLSLDGNRNHEQVRQWDSAHEGFRIQDGISCTELEGSQRRDGHQVNRMTLDFLGVGGPSRSVGVAMGMGEDLSQRDVGVKPDSLTYLEENVDASTEGGHFPSSED